jgi:hypothetical protein
MKNIVLGFVCSIVLALASFGGNVAYRDHQIVKQLAILTQGIGSDSTGRRFTGVDIVAALVDERIEQLKQAQAAANAAQGK